MSMMQSRLEDLFSFTPKTWLIPSEMASFKSYIADKQKKNKRKFFIIKPEANCQGNGIKLIRH